MPPAETFVRETYHSLSLSEAELLRRRTGLLAGMLPESWHEPAAIEDDADSPAHTFIGRTIQQCPTLLIVVHDARAAASTLLAGGGGPDESGVCHAKHVADDRESRNQHAGAQRSRRIGRESRVRALLDIPQHLKIAFAVRLGYPLDDSESYLRMRRKI